MAHSRSRTIPAVAVVAVSLLLAAGCTGKYVRKTTAETVAPTPERLARGDYLVNHVAACGSCHTTRDSGKLADPEQKDALLGGGNVIETPPPTMRVWVPNVTSDRDTGIGGWSDDQVMRAIRDGVNDEGKFLLPVMPFGSFRFMSNDDVRAVVAYLRSVPPHRLARKPVENRVPYADRVALESFGFGRHTPATDVVAPPGTDAVKYGEYVARLATCADCHSLGTTGPRGEGERFLGGSDEPFPDGGEVWAPNLTPDPETGLGRYDRERVKNAIRTGTRLDGKKLAPPMSIMAPHYAVMTDADLDALVTYLFAQKPVKNAVPVRKLDAATRARLGED